MAAIDFPSSPSVGQSFTSGDRTWIYNGVSWNARSTSGLTSQVIVSETQPTATVGGTQWFNTINGKTYIYYDGYWIEESSGLPGPEGQVGLTGPRGLTGAAGATGPQGPSGPANTLSVGTVSASASGSSPQVTITGTAPDQTINFVLPRGEKGNTGTQGDVGPANNLTIGFVVAGETASAEIAGTSPNQQLNLVLPRGERGLDGLDGLQGEPGVVAATAPITYNASTQTIGLNQNSLFASPAFTGIPTAPTATTGTNTTQLATTAFVRSEIAGIIDSAPSTLDTLNELAAALGDDPNFATTIVSSISEKADSVSPTISNPTLLLNIQKEFATTQGSKSTNINTVTYPNGIGIYYYANALAPVSAGDVIHWVGIDAATQEYNSQWNYGLDNKNFIVISNTAVVGQANKYELILNGAISSYDASLWNSTNPFWYYDVGSPSARIVYVSQNNVSPIEISYLDGATSNVQTQIDAKAPLTQAVVGVSSNYTFVAADKGKFFYAGGPITLTIPGNVFAAGDQIDIVSDAAGVITFAGSGLTIRSKSSKVTIATQYGAATIKFLSPTVAYLIGDLA